MGAETRRGTRLGPSSPCCPRRPAAARIQAAGSATPTQQVLGPAGRDRQPSREPCFAAVITSNRNKVVLPSSSGIRVARDAAPGSHLRRPAGSGRSCSGRGRAMFCRNHDIDRPSWPARRSPSPKSPGTQLAGRRRLEREHPRTAAWLFPKSANLPRHLLAVENELNNRPRRTLGDRPPAELFAALLASESPPVLRR